MRDLVLLGAIAGAHGIRGEVKLKSFTAEPEAIASYGPLVTRDGRSFEITRLRPAKDGFIASLRGVADRNQAEALRGIELLIPRDRLPAASEEEIYVHDLIGLSVVSKDGAELGEVISVENYGAGDLLDVKIAGRKDTALIPFTDDFVMEAGERIVVDLPDGYLDMEDTR